MKKSVLFLIGYILFVTMTLFSAESFRVRSVTTITVDSQNPDVQNVNIGYNDAIGILFPEDALFIKGVELEIRIPKEIIEYRNSMAYGIYNRISPFPSEKIIDYQANQLTLESLPSRLSFVLQIPLRKDHALKTGPYARVLQYVHDTTEGPLLFRLIPVMKGLPEDIEKLVFLVRIKPILTEEGGVHLGISYPEDTPEPISVRIDEMLVNNPDTIQILSPGTHHLSIVSDDFRNEMRMFTVESARITELSVAMKTTTPHLFLVAPENAQILLDSQPIEDNRDGIIIEPGDHTILFRIGDYELTKQISVEKGNDYTVSMIIDVNVTVSP